MEQIRTKRLLLRPFRETDYDDLFVFLSQLEDDEFEGYPGIDYENGREHLKYRLGSEEFYAIELPDEGKVIGNIYCGHRGPLSREVGYIVNKDYQRQGYGAEALCAVIESAFAAGAQRIYAQCDARNIPSRKLLEKAGLMPEKHFTPDVNVKGESGKRIDALEYAITRSDFEKEKRA